MKQKLWAFKLLAVLMLFFSVKGWGQFNIDAGSTNYSQNFDGLNGVSTWSNNTTLTGWYARTTNTASITTIGANTGSTTAAGLYSFGIAGTNPVTERSLGFGTSNSYTGTVDSGMGMIGWRLKNNTGNTITKITVTWTGEQWRKENNAASHVISLSYLTAATVTDMSTGTWTSANSIFTSPKIGATTATVLDGNAASNRTVNITSEINVSIPAGEEIMLRWEDLNNSGTDHSLSIDDVTINATAAAPTTPTLSATPTSLSGFTYVEGNGPSASQSYSLSGTNLDGSAVTVTAPTNYEVSLDNNTFTDTVNPNYTASNLNSTTIYVRLKSGLTAGTYNSVNVGNEGGNASNVNVGLSGSVTPPPPANDLCSGAISLVAGTPSNGTVVNATESPTLSEDNTEKDVWYKFTPTLNGNHTINLTVTGANSDYDIRVYSTTCPASGSSIFNAANSSMTDESLTANLTSGTEYFIRVIDYQGAGTTFSINVTAPLPADHLTLVNVPATGNVGYNIATFTVEARNSNNVVDPTYAGNVTISKASGSGNMTGTFTKAFVNGVATFNDIKFDAASTYTISAASGALTGATSGNIVVSTAVVYQKINSLAELTNGDYLIVDANDAVIAGNTITSGALVTSSVTPSSGQIINPNSTNVWTITTTAGVSTIQNTSNSRYLNYVSSTDLSLVTSLTNSNQEWTISYQSSYFRVSNVATTSRILKYNSQLSTPGFKAYTTSTTAPEVSLYKKVLPTTTWSGSSWSNGDPTSSSDLNVVIQDPYSGASFTANDLTINAALTINDGVSITTSGVVTNNGTITVSDNGNFIQQTGSTYTGSGTLILNKASTSTTNIFDLWSSPVVSQGMDDIFVTDGSLVREYLTATDAYATVSPTAVFGKGYAVRGTGTDVSATFTGTPNNGTNTFTLSNTLSANGNRYNLVGNPYPSNFNLITFYNTNQGDGSTTGITPTMYFYNSSAATDKWGTFNATAGGTWARANAATTETSVKPGQAFFVSARSASTTVSFDNSMRNAAAAVFVNKAATSTTEGKYWLELTTPSNNTTGFAVTYGYGASNSYDLFDSKMMSTGADAFYTYLGTEKLAIQGRDYFVSTDVVTLGNKHSAAGQYTISLVNKIGWFTAGQSIYLHDKELGTYTDLQTGNYSFTTNALEQQNRFEIVYQTSALGTAENVKAETKVYRDGEYFVVEASEKITGIEVYDASGRLVLTQQPNRMNARLLISSKGMYVIHIKTVKSETSKKVIK